MALSMMRAPIGSSVKVSGIRIAVPAAGPSPGSTPISVPRKQPISAKPRFCRLVAAVKPESRCWKVSTVASLSKSERADRQRHLEPVEEDMEDAEASRQRGEQNRGRRERAKRKQQTSYEEQHGQPEAEWLEECGCGCQRDEHAAGLPGRLLGRENASGGNVVAARGLDQQGDRQRGPEQAQPERKEARPRTQSVAERVVERGDQGSRKDAQYADARKETPASHSSSSGICSC